MKHLALLFLISTTLLAQSNEELLKQGLQYKAEYKNTEGLGVFQKLLKSDSNNVIYVYNASYFYSKCGAKLATDAEKMKYYRIAEYLAKKSIKLDKNNAETHYVYALALGRINENASSSVKIANAKLIKAEIDWCLKLNPKHAGAYHVLGRWHRTIAGFSGIEKSVINTFYGGVPPGGSYEEALKAFQNAITYEPKYILHQYELAVTYNEMGKKEFAKTWLQNALKIEVNDDDAKETKKKCEELLKKLK